MRRAAPAIRRAPRRGGPDSPPRAHRATARGARAPRRERADGGAAAARGTGRRPRLRLRARSGPRRGARAARADRASATRARDCSWPGPGSRRYGRWGRGATPGSWSMPGVPGPRPSRSAAEGRLPVAAGEPADATFRLERNVWNGTVEPRLLLRRAWACTPEEIAVPERPDTYLRGRDRRARPHPLEAGERGRSAEQARVILDRRGESPLAVLADARATGASVLAVCADVGRRLAGLRARAGGFAPDLPPRARGRSGDRR